MRRTSLFNLAIIRATAIGVGPSVVRKEHGAPRNAATYPTRLRHGGSAATRRLPALVRSAQKIDAAAGHLKQLLLFLTGTGAGMAEAIYLDWRDVDTTGAMVIGRRMKSGTPAAPRSYRRIQTALLRRRRQSTAPAGDQLL